MNIILSRKYIPKRYLGQNFLHDKKVIKKIISFINPNITDLLVEIGPGLAALTKPMCNILDNLIVIEFDKELSDLLKLTTFYKKIEIFIQDVNTFNFSNLSLNKKKMLRIFGNLPYNISVKFILYLIQFSKYIIDINIMVQKEVSNRLLATCGTKSYGRLSIIVQCYYDIFFGFKVLPSSFFPIPKVESSFIKIKPKLTPLYPLNKINDLSKVTFLAFQKRRKILRNSLSTIFTENMLLNLGINPKLRAENLSIKEYCKLASFLHSYDYDYI